MYLDRYLCVRDRLIGLVRSNTCSLSLCLSLSLLWPILHICCANYIFYLDFCSCLRFLHGIRAFPHFLGLPSCQKYFLTPSSSLSLATTCEFYIPNFIGGIFWGRKNQESNFFQERNLLMRSRGRVGSFLSVLRKNIGRDKNISKEESPLTPLCQ